MNYSILILKHIEGGFNEIDDGTWKVVFEGREDDDGNITTPEQDQKEEHGQSEGDSDEETPKDD